MLRLGLAVLMLTAGAAQAEMTTSPRPLPRPAALTALVDGALVGDAQVADSGIAAQPNGIRPMPRPSTLVALSQGSPVAEPASVPQALTAPVVRPMPRPAALAVPVPALLAVTVAPAPAGMIRPKPRPEVIAASAPVQAERGGLGGCSVAVSPKSPVRLTALFAVIPISVATSLHRSGQRSKAAALMNQCA